LALLVPGPVIVGVKAPPRLPPPLSPRLTSPFGDALSLDVFGGRILSLRGIQFLIPISIGSAFLSTWFLVCSFLFALVLRPSPYTVPAGSLSLNCAPGFFPPLVYFVQSPSLLQRCGFLSSQQPPYDPSFSPISVSILLVSSLEIAFPFSDGLAVSALPG